MAAVVTEEIDLLLSVDGELDVLEHLARVQLDVEHRLDARGDGGVMQRLRREGPERWDAAARR
mgnify:CR=1 FL=1